MKTKETTIEYFIPSTGGQWGYIYEVLLPQLMEVFGVHDIETAEQRMRKGLIKMGWMKESRSELDYFQVKELIRIYENFLANSQKHA